MSTFQDTLRKLFQSDYNLSLEEWRVLFDERYHALIQPVLLSKIIPGMPLNMFEHFAGDPTQSVNPIIAADRTLFQRALPQSCSLWHLPPDRLARIQPYCISNDQTLSNLIRYIQQYPGIVTQPGYAYSLLREHSQYRIIKPNNLGEFLELLELHPFYAAVAEVDPKTLSYYYERIGYLFLSEPAIFRGNFETDDAYSLALACLEKSGLQLSERFIDQFWVSYQTCDASISAIPVIEFIQTNTSDLKLNELYRTLISSDQPRMLRRLELLAKDERMLHLLQDDPDLPIALVGLAQSGKLPHRLAYKVHPENYALLYSIGEVYATTDKETSYIADSLIQIAQYFRNKDQLQLAEQPALLAGILMRDWLVEYPFPEVMALPMPAWIDSVTEIWLEIQNRAYTDTGVREFFESYTYPPTLNSFECLRLLRLLQLWDDDMAKFIKSSPSPALPETYVVNGVKINIGKTKKRFYYKLLGPELAASFLTIQEGFASLMPDDTVTQCRLTLTTFFETHYSQELQLSARPAPEPIAGLDL